MGMAVKGEHEHRLVRTAILQSVDLLTPEQKEVADRLVRRADLALERIKRRKANRVNRIHSVVVNTERHERR